MLDTVVLLGVGDRALLEPTARLRAWLRDAQCG